MLLILNEGERFVSTLEKWPYLSSSYEGDYTASTVEYDISTDWSLSDFAFVDQIMDKYYHKRRLIPVSFNEYLDMYGSDPQDGQPRYFYLRASDTIGFAPTPDTTTTSNAGFTVYYTKTPTVMTNTAASPEWVASHHDVLVDYGLYRTWEREEYFDERDKAFGRFVEGISLMKRFYNMRVADSPVVFGDGTWTRRSRDSKRDHFPFS
jgi:hypothetical protein